MSLTLPLPLPLPHLQDSEGHKKEADRSRTVRAEEDGAETPTVQAQYVPSRRWRGPQWSTVQGQGWPDRYG